jgi:DNA-binding response OmpR family regulator
MLSGRSNIMRDHVLIVDDDRDAADTIVGLVERCGFEAKAVYRGEDAVRETAKFLPDMVLIDLSMPGLDGYETIARIREKRPAAEIVIVAITAFSSDEHKRRAYEAGFDLFVAKPLRIKTVRELLALLKPEITGRHRGPSSDSEARHEDYEWPYAPARQVAVSS